LCDIIALLYKTKQTFVAERYKNIMSYETDPGGPSPLEQYRALHKKLGSMPLRQRQELLSGISDSDRATLMEGQAAHEKAQTQDAFRTLIDLPGGFDEVDKEEPDLSNPQPHSEQVHLNR
jgi:hypothetical protein